MGATRESEEPKRQRKNAPYSPWLMAALKVLKPPENITVSEWADKFRVLSPKDSAVSPMSESSQPPS